MYTIILAIVVVLICVYLLYPYSTFNYISYGGVLLSRDNEHVEASLHLLKSFDKKTKRIIDAAISKYDRHETHLINNMYKRYKGLTSLRECKHGAFTVSKGKSIAICLRNADGDLYNTDLLWFVFLHELTHVASNVKNHPPEFWKAFKFILKEAASIGEYTPVDYSKYPDMYGSLHVKYNPYYDDIL